MVTLAVLSADQRLSFQIHTWLKDLADSVRWETHTDLAEFAKKIETEVAADIVAQTKSATDDSKLNTEDIGAGKSASATDAYYRLLIVDLDLLQTSGLKPIEWTKMIKALMEERQRSDIMFPVRVLFLAFEGGGFKVDEFRDPAIDDLTVKPLDRSVFLQKIEIMVADNPNVKPTFLYSQKTNIAIEIGKDAVVDEISEFSLAIRNPAPLANGVFASVHTPLLGAADLARVIGRAYRSEPHPRLPGQYLVRFGFFGMRGDQHANVKKYIRARQPVPKQRPPLMPVADNDPAIPFNRVAVIDMNEDVFTDVQSTMKDHFVGVHTTHYLSYTRLLAALTVFYAAAPAPEASATADAANETLDDLHGLRAWTTPGTVSLQILSTSQEILKFETSLASGDTVLGRTRLEWNERPNEFFSRLDKQDANELTEMIAYTVSGGQGRSYLRMKDQSRRLFFVEANATLVKLGEGEEPSLIHVELKQIEKAEYLKNSLGKVEANDLLYDAIFIDVNLIRGDLQPWYDGLTEAYMKAGIVAPGQVMPKIVLLADDKTRIQPENFRNKIVADFIFKPLDRKMLSFKAKLAANELIPRKEPETPPFIRVEVPAKLAKDAQMEELSEYGLSIAHPTPFRKGAMMRFFSPLFGEGAEGVLGRCSHCEKKDEKIVSYICHFVFFGTPDEILKRIRNWIREDYVQRKEAP